MATAQAGYREIAPHPALRPFVECFWLRRDPAPAVQEILPDGCVDLLFDATAEQAFLIGAMTRPHAFTPAGPVDLVAVRFHPGGARLFVRDGLAQFTDGRLDLDQLGPWGRTTAAAVGSAAPGSRVAALQAELLGRLPCGHGDGIDAALAELRSAPAAFRVDRAAMAAGVSRQWFARAVQGRTGLAPKELQRILRLRAVLPALRGTGRLAAVAAAGGYADQAHLCRDARAIAGLPPGQLRAR